MEVLEDMNLILERLLWSRLCPGHQLESTFQDQPAIDIGRLELFQWKFCQIDCAKVLCCAIGHSARKLVIASCFRQ